MKVNASQKPEPVLKLQRASGRYGWFQMVGQEKQFPVPKQF